MNNSQTSHTPHLLPTGIFFLCAFLIAVACYAVFEKIKANEKKDTNKTLVSVGQLKTHEIQSYLAERKNDAVVVSSFLTTQSAQHWLTHQGGNAQAILNQLAESVVATYQYRGLLLLDAEANVRLNTGHSGILTEAGKAIAWRAMRERSPVSSKIYFGDPATPDKPVLDTFVPVMSPDGTMAVGMVVLRNELNYLFQLLQTWPMESETAETLLVTKDGSDVLFLNELRHQKNTTLKLRVPLNTDANSPAWPAISAVTGHLGLLEANDYRGKRILAYTLAVPGTLWSMVVKMDIEEAVAHSQRLLRVAIIIAVILIVFAGIIVWLWWRKGQADRLANQQLQESETRYRRLHESMMDAFIMVDMSGSLLDFNHAFLEMLGYPAEELLRQTCADLTPEKWHEFEARIIEEQVIPHGQSQVYEKEYIRQDGTVFPVELKYFLLRDTSNRPEAMWAIVRDITERKQAVDALRTSALKHQLLFESSRDALMLLAPPSWKFTGANKATLQLFGASSVAEFNALRPWDVSPEWQPDGCRSSEEMQEMIAIAIREGSHFFEWGHQRLDGQMFAADVLLTRMDVGEEMFLQATVRDITERKQAEVLAQQFGSLLQASFNEIYMFDADSLHFLLTSEGAEKNLGYPADELKQLTPLDIKLLFTRESFERLIAPLRTGEQPSLLFETVHRRKDSTTYPVEVRLQLMTGDSPVFLAIIQDITGRKRAEEAIIKAGEKFHILFDSISDAILISDMEGHFLQVNHSACERLGYSQEELLQMDTADIYPPEYAAKVPERVKALQELGKLVFESAHVRRDGVVISIELSARGIDYGGKPAFLAVARDITERKRAAELLRKSSEEIEDLYNHAPCGYHSLDKDGVIRMINDTELVWLGYTRDEVIGKMKWPDLLTFTGLQVFLETFPQLMEHGIVRNIEAGIIRKDGTVLTGLINAMAIYDPNGNYVMSRSTVTDITERKRAEQQLRDLSAHLQTVREEEKAGIAREIHDDLGGTLTALKMETHQLETELSQDKNALPLLEHVESMSQLINAAAGITRRIITDLRPTILDDLGLLAAIEWQAAQFHKRTEIEYLVNCIEDKGHLDKLHSIALFRILQEALTNVARHSGASRVEIEFHHSDEEVVLSISDNGRGLSDDRPVKSGSYGMLGMIERVEQLGGTIRFDIPPGGGLGITVIFPLTAGEWSI